MWAVPQEVLSGEKCHTVSDWIIFLSPAAKAAQQQASKRGAAGFGLGFYTI
jgi:hypothetical protein